MWRDCDQQLYNDLRIFKVVFGIYLLADVLQELNVLSKNFQTENVDLSQLGAQIELTTRPLTRMFLNANNFGGDSKYVKTFMEVAEDRLGRDIMWRMNAPHSRHIHSSYMKSSWPHFSKCLQIHTKASFHYMWGHFLRKFREDFKQCWRRILGIVS